MFFTNMSGGTSLTVCFVKKVAKAILDGEMF